MRAHSQCAIAVGYVIPSAKKREWGFRVAFSCVEAKENQSGIKETAVAGCWDPPVRLYGCTLTVDLFYRFPIIIKMMYTKEQNMRPILLLEQNSSRKS